MTSFSGSVAIRVMDETNSKYQATIFPGTTAGLQAAIDSLSGTKGKVVIGPGTLETDDVISIHSGCHIQGSGINVTTIKRAAGSIEEAGNPHNGDVFISSAYGNNGVLATAAVTDITVSDITLDGNFSAFGSIVSLATCRHIGIQFQFADGVRIDRVRFQNFFQVGCILQDCRNGIVSCCEFNTTGQWASPNTNRNGLDFQNNNVAGAGWNRAFQATNIRCDTVTDAPIHLGGVTDVAISDVIAKGSRYFFEFNNYTFGSCKNVVVSNATATSITEYFLEMTSGHTGTTYENISFTNCTCDFDSSSHITSAIRLCNDQDMALFNVRLEQISLRNINSSDTSAKPYIYLNSTSSTVSKQIVLRGLTLIGGATSSVQTTSHGFDISGNISGLEIVGCELRFANGTGINVRPKNNSQTISDVLIAGNFIYNSNGDAINISTTTATSPAIKRITVCNNYIEDCAEIAGNCAVSVGTDVASGTCSGVSIYGNRLVKVAAAAIGRVVTIRYTGTTDNVYIGPNDTENLTTILATSGTSGTLTNLRYNCRPGRGTDITAAATISIPTDGNVFHVTGNTNITNGITVNVWDNGRKVYLIFDGTPTVSDTGTSKLRGAFVATADDVLPLVCDGTNWYQAAFESVN